MSVRSFEPEMENWMATVVQELPFNLRTDQRCAFSERPTSTPTSTPSGSWRESQTVSQSMATDPSVTTV
jgi:hypothetical protein